MKFKTRIGNEVIRVDKDGFSILEGEPFEIKEVVLSERSDKEKILWLIQHVALLEVLVSRMRKKLYKK